MTRPERKRGFSQAFQIAMSGIPGRQTQVPKTVASPAFSPGWLEDSNKENLMPYENVNDATCMSEGSSKPNFHYPPDLTPLQPQHLQSPALRSHPLQALIELSQNNRQAPSQMLLPGGEDPFALNITFDFSSPINGEVLEYMDSEPGPIIYEDSIMMEDMLAPAGSLTPSALNMQDLSLVDGPKRPLPDVPARLVVKQNRASVEVVPTSDWIGAFTDILPNDIIIVFAKGKEAVKVDKYPLCASSRFFTTMLDGPFLPGRTRVIRLRDDFPWAVKAMIQFIDTSNYTFQPAINTEHPNITVLDLHIHAYIIGAKYAIPQLCDHALLQYIDIAHMYLSMETDAKSTSQTSTFVIESAKTILNQFIDSLALLWRSTPNRHDALRAEVLELIKANANRLVRLPAFVELIVQLEGFGGDVVSTLGEDGFEVQVFLAEKGGVRFA